MSGSEISQARQCIDVYTIHTDTVDIELFAVQTENVVQWKVLYTEQ